MKERIFPNLNDKLERTSDIGIAADNNDDVDIAYSHVKERASADLPNRASPKFFRLHYMCPKCIHHISPAKKFYNNMNLPT